MSGSFRFDRFALDPADRQLRRDDAPVELNARYFDALALLVGEAGRLVPKDRFLGEVWRGVPVTDEALTQCIKTLRRQLDDDASNPRFIETVPKHGYRFIAPVERVEDARRPARSRFDWREFVLLGAAGTIGGGVAGFFGGLFYGFAGASQPLQPGMGAISVLLVLLCLTILVALIGGAGVAFGIAAAGARARPLLAGRRRSGRRPPRRRDRQAPRPRCIHFADRPLARRHHRVRSKAWSSAARSGSAHGSRAASRRLGRALSLRRLPAPSEACSLPCSAGG